MRTIRISSVVFGVTSSLAVIHTIHGQLWLCIVRERAWLVSLCRTTATVTGYCAWRLVVEYPHTRNNEKPTAGAIYKAAAAVIDRKARYSLKIGIIAFPTCIRLETDRNFGFGAETDVKCSFGSVLVTVSTPHFTFGLNRNYMVADRTGRNWSEWAYGRPTTLNWIK